MSNMVSAMDDFSFTPRERAQIAMLCEDFLELANLDLAKMKPGKYADVVKYVRDNIELYRAIRDKAIGLTEARA